MLVAASVNPVLGECHTHRRLDRLSLPLDGRVLATSFLVSPVAAVVFGLLPAWLASRQDVVTTLKPQARGSTSGRGQRLARRGLIVAEVSMALALLAVAGVMIRGFGAMLHKDAGWDTAHLLVANIHLPEQSTYDTEDKRRLAIERLERRLADIPGAEATAICTTPPYFGYSRSGPIQVEGQTPDDPISATDGRLRHGWAGLLRDPRHSPARGSALHGGPACRQPAGRGHRRVHGPEVLAERERRRQAHRRPQERRGGVARGHRGRARHRLSPESRQPRDHPSDLQAPGARAVGVSAPIGPRGAPASFKNDVHRAVADVDPDVAVQETFTIPEATDRYEHNIVVVNNMLGAFALLGLVLAAVGLYGVISNLVAHRTAEFGIRLALGAAPRDVLGLVLGGGVRLTLAGLAVGAGLAYALIRLLGSEMPRMATADPVTLAGVVAVLFAVALFACYWPARRATRVDPLVALRAE